MDDSPRRRFSWAHVLFGVAVVSTVAFTAFPFSAYNFGRLTGALAFGFVVRLVYVKLGRGAGLPVWSGWIFVLALLPAWASHGDQKSQAVDQSSKAAVRHGVVASEAAATPRDRCVGLPLDDCDAQVGSRVHLPRRTIRVFVHRVCVRALGNEVAARCGAKGSSRASGPDTRRRRCPGPARDGGR